MKRNKQLSIIYVYYNTPQELYNSLITIKDGVQKISYEVIIINNASSLSISKEVTKMKFVTIIKNKKNIGYGSAVNQAVKMATGEYLLVTNPDTLFEKNSIFRMFKKINSDNSIGIIGPQMLSIDKKILPTISQDPSPLLSLFSFSFFNTLFPKNFFSKKYWMYETNKKKQMYVFVISGACFLIKKQLFQNVGGFDSQFFMYFEENDLCRKVRGFGKKILYYPESKIIHFIGKSTKDIAWIEQQFEKSRFLYLKKYYGTFQAILTEGLIRITKTEYILLLLILLMSTCINLYEINTYMLFIGDMGRDYLAARDMILSGNVPLVGIQSSVTWLHQGPLSIYCIGLIFLLTNFNPIAPAGFYGILGVVTTYLIYRTGKRLFNSSVGLLSALFFATSPLAIVNTRMPYHTSPIPFFAILSMMVVYAATQNKSIYLFVFFFLGLLLQVELSNIIVVVVVISFFLLIRTTFRKKELLLSCSGFLIGITPFILYDISHNFVQTIGFPLWILNRIRLFFGIATHHSTSLLFIPAVKRINQQLASTIFPASQVIAWLVLIVAWLTSIKKLFINFDKGFLLVFLWVFIPLIGYLIHASPGTAYFPVVFPALSILLGYSVYTFKKFKFIIVLFVLLCIFNALFSVSNEYFLITQKKVHSLPPDSYVLGTSIDIQKDIVQFIVRDADGKEFSLNAGGFISHIATSIDNYRYLVWYYHGKENPQAKLKYYIFQDKNEVNIDEKIVYKNKYIFVVKK